MNPIDETSWEDALAEQPLVELTDPTGRVLRFRFVAALEYEGVPYVVLADLAPQSAEEDELVLLRVQPDPEGGADQYVMLDDQDELQAVFGEYMSQALHETLSEIDFDFDEEEAECGCGCSCDIDGCQGDCGGEPRVLH